MGEGLAEGNVTKFAVYGHTGVVGSQLYRWLRERGADVAGVSLDRSDGEVGVPEWAFLCLPTLTGADGAQEQDAIWQVCNSWQGRNVGVVIRSTVLPGTCARLAEAHPELTIYHWPEFLSARSAWEDFISPRARFVGCDMTSRGMGLWAEAIEPLLPVAVEGTRYMSTATSETLKYAHNVHGAMQVIYANQVYDVCNASGADWRQVRDALPQLGYVSHRQMQSYWDVWKDDKRGYGGTCFPKDVRALRAWLHSLSQPCELLDGMEAANARLRGGRA